MLKDRHQLVLRIVISEVQGLLVNVCGQRVYRENTAGTGIKLASSQGFYYSDALLHE